MEKIKEIFLATNNAGKAAEFRRIFKGITIRLPSEEGIHFDVQETGRTYIENALLKAESLYGTVKSPVLADDSGLSVEYLSGRPGVASSRYGMRGGGKMTDREKNLLLLKELKGVSGRRAWFVCCMILYLESYRFLAVQETLAGEIAEKISGTAGFGYDPVFFVPDLRKTVAELSDREKDGISHRGKAGRKIYSLIGGG